MFRDSQMWHMHPTHQVDLFFKNILEQEGIVREDLVFFLLEGDSLDDTWPTLLHYRRINPDLDIRLFRKSVPGPGVKSVVMKERFDNLSEIGNTIVRPAREECDLILWCESDLLPPKNLLHELLKATEQEWWNDTLAVAPIPVINCYGSHKLMYDSWGFVDIDGKQYHNSPPEVFTKGKPKYLPMNSIGSCAILNGKRMREFGLDFGTYCFRALCDAGREKGLKIFADTELIIYHPGNLIVEGRWI